MSGSETNHCNDLLCIAEIFESIANKDEQALARTLERSSIETVLLFESVYGISPLLHCVQTGEMSRLGLVRRLLVSGLCDSETVDSKGRTVLAGLVGAQQAQTQGTAAGFLERMIEIVIEGADDTTACYRMLKHNSLALFQAFLELKQFDERRLFECLTGALTKLSVKQVLLSADLRVFVMFKLADFGFRRLSGDWTGGCDKTTDEWKDHIDVVSDCWNVIGKSYDTGSYGDVDDRLLQRLHVLHNHLYFLQHKKFLDYLALREAIFCVAVFWNVLKNPATFTVYRVIVNKRIVIECIRMIAFQLMKVKRFLEQTEQKLCEIVKEGESLIVKKKEYLIEDIMNKMKISCKPTVIKQFEEKSIAIGKGNSNRDMLIKDMIKRIRKDDKEWADTKSHELRALRQTQKEWLIEQLETRLKCVKQPKNVADLIMAELKRNRVDTVAARIVASESFDLEHLMRGKDRRTRRKMIKCYGQLRQLYSLDKIVLAFAQVARVNPANVELFQDSLKRTVMILGEMLKNTNSTPNMPNDRLEDAMGRMISHRFADIVISIRNSYARQFSLSRLLIDAELERRVYSFLPNHTVAVRMVINLLFVLVMVEVRRSFYGQLVRCGSLEALRSLLIYAGEKDVLFPTIHIAFEQVTGYFSLVKELLAELRENPIGNTIEFAQLEEQFEVQCGIVEEVQAMLATERELDYENLRKTCFSCNDLPTIRRLLHWKIDTYRPNVVLESICSKWNAKTSNLSRIHWMDTRLTWIDTETMSNKLAMITCAIGDADAYYNIGHTGKLIEQLGIADEVDEEGVDQLNKRLAPYYANIFFLDNKWKVLESFCKQRRLSWNKTLVRQLRQRDQELLQTLYDERRHKLKTIFEQNDIQTVEVLQIANIIIKEDTLASLEHLQLELCEILTAVGYFGDSFHCVKQRIPMIQGKNFRNLLAHDSLSYNMLTDSGNAKTILNAYIFVHTEVRLFESRQQDPIELHLPSLADMYRWLEEQQQLLASFQCNDVRRVHALMRSGGAITAYFCFTPNAEHYPAAMLSAGNTIQGFCDRAPSIVPLLGRYFPYLRELYHRPEFALETAIVQRDFETAFKLVDETKPLEGLFYSWPKLMMRLSPAAKASKTLTERRNLLDQFLDYGNEECIREMVRLYPDFCNTLVDRHTVDKAILRGLRSTAELMMQGTNQMYLNALERLVILHWNDTLENITIKSPNNDEFMSTILRAAIKARNETALKHILGKTQTNATILGECYLTAASFGRCSILKHLLQVYPLADQTVLSTAIHKAALSNQWPCVRLLLEADAPVDVLVTGYQDEDANVLLLLVASGQVKLIRRIRTLDPSIYGTRTNHPLAVAVGNDTASGRMVQALRAHGFGWLDSSATLHEVILEEYEQPAWKAIWGEIDHQLSRYQFTNGSDHVEFNVSLLHRWKTICFVEECNMDRTSLCCAAETKNPRVIRELLDRACSMRQIEGVGVLGDVVFQKEGSFVHYYKKADNVTWSMESCCADMISRMEGLLQEGMIWHELTIVVGNVSVSMTVLKVTHVPKDVALELRDSTLLEDNLQDLLNFTDAFGGSKTVVYGTFYQGQRAIHFLRNEDLACVYDVFPPDASVDLSNTLNIRAAEGKTVLGKIVEAHFDLETVQLLVQHGANPLLADCHGNSIIHSALCMLPDAALYLMEECLTRDLRNAKGDTLLELDDRTDGNKLIHMAASCGQQIVVAKLLDLNIDVTVRNAYGCTPAHVAVVVPLVNSISTLKQLLDYDRTPVDMTDRDGGTLLVWAAKTGSIEMLNLIMQYKPNLTLPANRRALYEAVNLQYVDWAKRFLQHAIEAGAREVTKMEDAADDVVILSLRCADFELSKALLEYELQHGLEDITERDRPRIESVLKASTSKIPQVPVELYLSLKGLSEDRNFLTYLRNMLAKLEPSREKDFN
ncbi:uncharacterized protein LOC4577910 [Anopheles gambiae]|uniref:uncharacterized protein LOC4577910 n=1 Tax=Anopheles gambiae TaxID=7165 RepID=UPI002AC97095|nr:uncharacterized protein LOC4577910 [Anopheles gambiae]